MRRSLWWVAQALGTSLLLGRLNGRVAPGLVPPKMWSGFWDKVQVLQKTTRICCPGGVPAFMGMTRRNPGSNLLGDEAKVGLVGIRTFPKSWRLRIGPWDSPISQRFVEGVIGQQALLAHEGPGGRGRSP